MPFLLTLATNRYFWLALAFAGLTAWGAYWRHDAKATEEAFSTYRAQVIAQGIVAAQKAKEIEARQKKAHDEVTDDLTKKLASLDALNKRLRDSRAGGGVLPSAPRTPEGAPARACADWSQLERALSAFVGETAGLAEEGDRAEVIRDAWRAWWEKVAR